MARRVFGPQHELGSRARGHHEKNIYTFPYYNVSNTMRGEEEQGQEETIES
jgi:hypothetical protein